MGVKQSFFMANVAASKASTGDRLKALSFLKYGYGRHLPETKAQLLPKILTALHDGKPAIRLKALEVLVENHDGNAQLLATIFEAIKEDASLFGLPIFISLAFNLPHEKLKEDAGLAHRFNQLKFVANALSYEQKLQAISCMGNGVFDKEKETRLVNEVFGSIREKITADELFELPPAVLLRILSDTSLSPELRSSAATEISHMAGREKNLRDKAIATLAAFKNEEGRVGYFCTLGLNKLSEGVSTVKESAI